MRRLLVTAFVVLAAAASTGCSGADAQEAQLLLTQSQQAMDQVESFRFSMRMWTSGAPDDFTMTMRGGGYAKGKRGGEFFLTATVEGAPTVASFSLVSKKGVAYMNMGQGWQRVPLPPSAATPESANPFEGFDVTSYVKKVNVDVGTPVDGEPTTKITGVVDTEEMLKGMLGQISGAGASGFDFSNVFGDVRVVAFISDRTHLVRRGLMDFPMKILGEKVELHMDFALDGIDEPVRIPNPA